MTQNNPITSQLDQVDQLLAQQQYARAAALLENIHKTYPDEEPVLLRLAWAQWDAGNKDRAIACLETLLERELRHKVFTGFAYDELARIYKQEGLIDRLMAMCEKVVAIQPEDVGFLTELGMTCLLAGYYDKACDTFQKLISMEEDNPFFACRLGEARLCMGDSEGCIQAFEQAAQIDPDEADRYFFQAADLFLKRNDAKAAERLLDKCLKLAPSNSLYHCSRGDILIALHQIDEAFMAYEEACRQNSHHAAAYFNRLGNTLMKVQQFTPAIRAFETALAYDASIPCRQNLERAYQESGRVPA